MTTHNLEIKLYRVFRKEQDPWTVAVIVGTGKSWTLNYTMKSSPIDWMWIQTSILRELGKEIRRRKLKPTDACEQELTGQQIMNKVAKYGWMFVDPLSKDDEDGLIKMPN